MKPLVTTFLISFLAFTSCSLFGGGDPGPNIPGKIVFSAKDDEGTSQIYTMKANGTDVKQLTHFGPDGGAADPAWSPDGQRIVFANYTGATTLGPYLYVMDTDGGNMRPLKRMQRESPKALIGSAPAWSPDGTKIAYQVCTNCERGGEDYEIVVVDAAGETYDPDQVHAVTDHPASDTHPAWSPDSRRIAFVSDRDYIDADTLRFREDLYVVKTDGSNLKRLTKTGYVKEAQWNPEDNFIIFRSFGSNPGLYRVNLQSLDVTLVKKDLKKEIQLHPVALNSTGTRLLVVTYEFNRSHQNTLYILNIKNGQMQEIYSKTSNNANFALMGADWFTPNNR